MKTEFTLAWCVGPAMIGNSSVRAQTYAIPWYTIDGGGTMTAAGGAYQLAATIGQPDAGAPMSGGSYELVGGFWALGVPAGSGVPAATITSAVSRKPVLGGPVAGSCDTPTFPGAQSEPHQGGISELRVSFDVPPGGPGGSPVTLEQRACGAAAYAPYFGASSVSAAINGTTLVLNFTPGLENSRRYRVTFGPEVTSIAGQTVEVRGLVGDVNSDGFVNATDRSTVVGAWTGPGGFTCPTDINSDGQTNATDRSIVVGAWTGVQNCAP